MRARTRSRLVDRSSRALAYCVITRCVGCSLSCSASGKMAPKLVPDNALSPIDVTRTPFYFRVVVKTIATSMSSRAGAEHFLPNHMEGFRPSLRRRRCGRAIRRQIRPMSHDSNER